MQRAWLQWIVTVPSLNVPLTSSIFQHLTGNMVGIRGLGAPRVLFLLDAMPINDLFFGYVLFNKIVQETAKAMLFTRVVPCHGDERLHRWR